MFDLGEWSSELPLDDYITEFASAGPKTYAIKTASGKHDTSKSERFSLHYKNQQVIIFDSLKEQAISKHRVLHQLRVLAIDSIIQSNACIEKAFLVEELSAMRLRKPV